MDYEERKIQPAELVSVDGKITEQMFEYDFDCVLHFEQYEEVRLLKYQQQKDLNYAQYSFNGRMCTGMDAFMGEETEPVLALPLPGSGKVTVNRNMDGGVVLRMGVTVPVFDSSDRIYDGLHSLYLFHDTVYIYGAYCRSGYVLASITIGSRLVSADSALQHLLKEFGFPLGSVQF